MINCVSIFLGLTRGSKCPQKPMAEGQIMSQMCPKYGRTIIRWDPTSLEPQLLMSSKPPTHLTLPHCTKHQQGIVEGQEPLCSEPAHPVGRWRCTCYPLEKVGQWLIKILNICKASSKMDTVFPQLSIGKRDTNGGSSISTWIYWRV